MRLDARLRCLRVQTMDSLNYFLADMDLPSELRERAREYVRNKRDLYKKAMYNDLLTSSLSPELRIEVVGKMSGDMLTSTVWYLRELERACLIELALRIERAVYAPREKIPMLGLNILMRGVCARAGIILTPISTWGEDVIVTAPVLRDKRAVRCVRRGGACEAASARGCERARLRGCEAARLRGCEGARARGCEGARARCAASARPCGRPRRRRPPR